MLTCADFLTEFGDYLEDAVSPDVRARLDEHLQECKTCHVIVDSTRKTIGIVTESGEFALLADEVEPIVSDVMARIRKKP
jgi:predicted anti-sigma-YlaC factor YlaD